MNTKETRKPPKWALNFFRWFCNPDYLEDIEGDLWERFEKRTNENKAARSLFSLDVLRLFRPGIIKPIKVSQELNNYGMIHNYYKVSMRNILRNKIFSLLNVSGLSVGIGSCILILIYVNNELSYDTYNDNYDRTYRVLHYFGNAENMADVATFPASEFQVWGNATAAPSLKSYFPEIDQVFRFAGPTGWLVENGANSFQENELLFADSTAFDVFSWKLTSGDPKSALSDPHTVVLTPSLAEKYFGKTDPIGKVLTMDGSPFKVTGIVEVPSNSHFTFSGLVSMSTYEKNRPDIFEMWGYAYFYTYFTLQENASIASLDSKISQFIAENDMSDSGYSLRFEPMSDVYLKSDAGRPPGPVGSLNNIYIFTSVAAFILLIACINFMNLATARSVERAKEVAIRKTIGSQRRSLVYQFLVEALLITFIAFFFAAVLVYLAHPLLETISGKTLPIAWLFTIKNAFLSIGLLLVIGIVAGSYPAFVLTSFKPVKVLKGNFKSSSNGTWLRKSLVVLQFSLSITLLAGASIVSSQLSFLQNYDLGFDSEQVLVIPFNYDGKVQRNRAFIKEQFRNHPDVKLVSVSRAAPGDFFPNAGTGVEDPISGEIVFKGPAIYEVDEDFVPTYKMNIVAGRNFSKDFPLDSANSLILNESAAKLFGYPNPEDIIGASFDQWGRKGKVIGVVEDFNYVSLHNEVEPLSIRYGTRYNVSVFSLKVSSDNFSQTLSELEAIWSRVAPHRPFDIRFVNDSFHAQYESDRRFGLIFSVFSGLAIFVACLGLLGLTIYSTNQRIKEIGVRKVLGASTGRIVTILSKDFLTLFAISLIISIPISWYAMNRWLEGFAYRISPGPDTFLLSALLTLIVAFLTMSFKTVRAASANPVDSLRDE